MPRPYLPLRWESTGDQWWFASPIDWAAANGHYDLVRELLHHDTNLLFKLTSLRRIRRLETVWDDEEQFDDVAKCRCQVARQLLLECESSSKKCHNSLLRAGYGGWLLYTAASAGDMGFIKELLKRDPLLVFGEGEYGVADILYAAARGKSCEVFRLLLDSSISLNQKGGEELEGGVALNLKMEMMNRGVHSAARGGNVEILMELLWNCSDVLVYRDGLGSSLLHSAAGRGQVEVLKSLLASYDIIDSRDDQGNTALHVAAYRGYSSVVKALISSSPSSASLTNNNGDTFLHMAVAGFRTPSFHRLDRQIELVKKLVHREIGNIEDIINARNNDGKTALHVAVSENVQTDLVELLMTVFSIDLNIRDGDGHTPLDLLRQHPRSGSSEVLIKRLVSAGGISSCQDQTARSVIASQLKMQGIVGSPGASFSIHDAEILLYTGVEKAYDGVLSSGEISPCQSSSSHKKSISRRLKFLMEWPKNDKETTFEPPSRDKPVSLRQRFSRTPALPNNKRVLSVSQSLPSPSTKKKFAAGLRQGVIQVMPQSSWASPESALQEKGRALTTVRARCFNSSLQSREKSKLDMGRKHNSFSMKVMNQFSCFGAEGISVNNPGRFKPQQNQCLKQSVAT